MEDFGAKVKWEQERMGAWVVDYKVAVVMEEPCGKWLWWRREVW